jgi:hypothetical protein
MNRSRNTSEQTILGCEAICHTTTYYRSLDQKVKVHRKNIALVSIQGEGIVCRLGYLRLSPSSGLATLSLQMGFNKPQPLIEITRNLDKQVVGIHIF